MEFCPIKARVRVRAVWLGVGIQARAREEDTGVRSVYGWVTTRVETIARVSGRVGDTCLR